MEPYKYSLSVKFYACSLANIASQLHMIRDALHSSLKQTDVFSSLIRAYVLM